MTQAVLAKVVFGTPGGCAGCFISLEKVNKENNATIIMITHNLELAKVADKIIEIADGRIVGEEK